MQARYGALIVLWASLVANGQSIFQVVPTPNGHHSDTGNNVLWAAAASSASDIWAVGQTTIHFDGVKWTAYNAPGVTSYTGDLLTGVVDISPTQAWAVGYVNSGLTHPGQVIEQWNGTQWTQYTGLTFNSGDQPALYGMAAVSATDIWALGSLLTGSTQFLEALYEHWDGNSWTKQTGPLYGFTEGVSAVAANDIWAVGTTLQYTFALHYDGNSWTPVFTPNVGTGKNTLWKVAALAHNNVWAVGSSADNSNSPTKTLIEHYDGTGWRIVPSPNVGPKSASQNNELRGLAAVSPTDIWAFGDYELASPYAQGQRATLLLHWDGNSWTLQPCPSPQPGDFMSDYLDGGVVTGPGNVWIVGSMAPAITGKPVTGTLVLHTTGG